MSEKQRITNDLIDGYGQEMANRLLEAYPVTDRECGCTRTQIERENLRHIAYINIMDEQSRAAKSGQTGSQD